MIQLRLLLGDHSLLLGQRAFLRRELLLLLIEKIEDLAQIVLRDDGISGRLAGGLKILGGHGAAKTRTDNRGCCTGNQPPPAYVHCLHLAP